MVSSGEHLIQIHTLAYQYHWGYNELLDIPRKDRKMYYEMVLEQLKAERDSVNDGNKSTSSKGYAESS